MVVRYLGLAIWPRGLVLDYGEPLPVTLSAVAPHAAAVAALLAATTVALVRRPAIGCAGAWFFLTLAADAERSARAQPARPRAHRPAEGRRGDRRIPRVARAAARRQRRGRVPGADAESHGALTSLHSLTHGGAGSRVRTVHINLPSR